MIKQQFAATHTPERVAYRLTEQDVEDMIAGFLAAKGEPNDGTIKLQHDCSLCVVYGSGFTIWREVEP